jgi:hypothetical protein
MKTKESNHGDTKSRKNSYLCVSVVSKITKERTCLRLSPHGDLQEAGSVLERNVISLT